MEEQWNVIQEFPDYAVSNHGRIKRIITKSSRGQANLILKPQPDSGGYLKVRLWKDGLGHTLTVHALVIKYFIGDRPSHFMAHHKNGNKRDNRTDNLEILPSYIHLSNHMSGENHYRAKLTEEKINQIRSLISYGYTQKVIANIFGVSRQTISGIKRLKSWKSYRIPN